MNLNPSRKHLRNSVRLFSIFLILLGLNTSSHAGIFDEGDAESGKKLFNANCASCHNVTAEPKTGPGLLGIAERWGSTEEMLVKWIQNPAAALKTGDPYIQGVVDVWRPSAGLMNAQVVTEAQIKDIMRYIQDGAGDSTSVSQGPMYTTIYDNPIESDGVKKLIIMIFILLFIIIIASLSSVRKTMNNMASGEALDVDDDTSYWSRMKAWMWERRVVMGILGFLVFCSVITLGYIDLMGIGVYEGYTPEQPIKFHHAIHVDKHGIDCEYCHFTPRKSKHASIPHAMLCMNCHKEVKEGENSGTKEIAKIYESVGFDTETNTYIEGYEQQPIDWVKVHNLPDHVFFSHQQHVEVGNIDCKQCHGPVNQFVEGMISPVELTNSQNLPGQVMLSKPTLTMGWCIECHRESKIDMSSSGYYEDLHARMVEEGNELGNEFWRKINEDNIITVKEMGGWECAKCHY